VRQRWSATGVALLAVCAVGCGSGETKPAPGPAGRPAGAEIEASQAADKRIGLEVKSYLIRNCPKPDTKAEFSSEERESRFFPEVKRISLGTIALCNSISTITVDDTRVTIVSGLSDDAAGRAAGEAFCLLIQGSDVADFTSGHELQDIQRETITVCSARSD
jgi:hypothetical protein